MISVRYKIMQIGDRVRIIGAQTNIQRMIDMIGSVTEITKGINDYWQLAIDETWVWGNDWLELVDDIKQIEEQEITSMFI